MSSGRREFGRSPAVLGRWITLNDVPVMIVGVNPKSFTGAQSTLPSDTPAVTVALAKGDNPDAVRQRQQLARKPGRLGQACTSWAARNGCERPRRAGGARHTVLRQSCARPSRCAPVKTFPGWYCATAAAAFSVRSEYFATPMSVLMMFRRAGASAGLRQHRQSHAGARRAAAARDERAPRAGRRARADLAADAGGEPSAGR